MLRKDAKATWRQRARECLALAFGGKCTICGYNKTITALDYHHIDASKKDSQLSKAMRNGYAWSKIVQEARKCTLVCCRCHRELHAGVTQLPKDYAKFNEAYADKMTMKQTEFDTCPICGQEKMKRNSYCSQECSSISQRKFHINPDELEKLVQLKPITQIGKMFNVSDNAIRHRCKTLGIKIPRKKRQQGA